jgi:hypothetical protein
MNLEKPDFMNLEKAKLKPAPGESGEEIEFMFNPTQLQFTRTVNWGTGGGSRGQGTHHPPPAEDNSLLPKTNFSGIKPYSLIISKILFDTYETGGSVRDKYISKLQQAVLPAQQQGNSKDKRPPVYLFIWGRPFHFRCVVQKLNFTYKLFLPNGTPLQAEVTLNLQEVDKITDTNTNARPDRNKGRR